MPKIPKKHNTAPQQAKDPVLVRMRKRILVQAGMAVTAITLTIVMIFAMTAAWYTNIVHTSGLTFEVEAWGFNGDITSEMLPIVAGPGDDGIIDLEVDSDSDSPSAVSVSFSKDLMPELMQQRIYFYVDAQVVRNNEIMDRVYLNSRESYTYNLFSQGKLTLTETVHNAPQLKWHWVYDVLGYYVRGDLLELAEGTKTLINIEYLRPIEYDYDKATMEYVTGEDGTTTMALKTVDGTLSPEQFLAEFSKTDGYEGVIDPAKVLVDDKGFHYYPVEVDEDQNGVYAYLCSYAEIQTNTADDTALGQGDYSKAQPPYTARLMVSAQKSKNSVITVTSLSGLDSAVELGVANSIKLGGDVTIGDGDVWTIRAGQRVMLDLDGHKLISTDPDQIPIVVEEGASLTVLGGEIVYQNDAKASAGCAVQVTGAEVVMSNVKLSGYQQGMKVADNTAPNSLDSRVRLVNCEWSTDGTCLVVYGNGSDTVQKTQIVIEGSTLKSNKITVSGNGSAETATDGGNYGTDIQIIDSTIISADQVDGKENRYSAIYQPQRDSVLTIYNSEITGYTGIAIKGGTVNILGSDVTGKGNGMATVEGFANSGFNDTGDAVYIETNYNYPIELNISDLVTGAGENAVTDHTRLTSSRFPLRVHDPRADSVKVNIFSGTFQGATGAWPEQEQYAPVYVHADSELKWDANESCYVVSEKAAQTPEQNGGAG